MNFEHKTLAAYFQSCHDEEEDGEEVKSFEVGDRFVSQMFCPRPGLGSLVWRCAMPCSCVSEGEGDGEAEALVSAGSTP